uniref:CSON000164 protein n=1 Tax=Culicoides sonorensis TaxID=179676 RepID=A0A336LP90_CULSO
MKSKGIPKSNKLPSPEKFAKISTEKLQSSGIIHKVINRQLSEELSKIDESDEIKLENTSDIKFPHKTIVHFQTFQKNSLMILHTPLSTEFLDELRQVTKTKIEINKLGHFSIIGSEQQVALSRYLIQEKIKLLPNCKRGRLNSI